MLRYRSPYIFLPIAAFIAIVPLVLRGCSCGHDFDFHLINWFEVARQLAHGTLHPHWAFTPAWNAGEPRFVFYPPLSWLLGALLGFIMPWTWTPIAYTWIVLTAAGFALYSTVRSYATPNAALVAAALYLTNPYILYTAYERAAYAELLAAVWLPLALHAVLRRHISIPAVAIPVALLWLTNAPAAVMGCYAMAAVILFRLILSSTVRIPSLNTTVAQQSPIRLALNSSCGVLLGLGLSAFYLLPAAYERRFVQINFAILPGLRPWDNFLFQRTADPEHDLVLHTASILALILTTLMAAVLLWIYLTSSKPNTLASSQSKGDLDLSSPLHLRKEQSPGEDAITPEHFKLVLAFLTAGIAFMLTPLSAPLWRYLPELRFLQFPWRLLAVLGPLFGFALALVLRRFRLRSCITALLCAVVFVLPSYYAFHQRCYPEDTVSARLTVFRSSNPGTDPTDEYTPITADNDSLSEDNPGYWLAAATDTAAPPSSVPGPAPLRLDLSPATATTLVLNLRDYPAWRVTVNHSLVATRLKRKDGLIAIPLPGGPAHIEIRYAMLSDQKLGYVLSLLSLLLFGVLVLRSRTPAEPC
jgi:hypothetical protein